VFLLMGALPKHRPRTAGQDAGGERGGAVRTEEEPALIG